MNNQVVIYTALVGGYDNVIDPLVVNEGIDYICFVGKGEQNRYSSKIWRFVEIEQSLNDKGRLSRFPKLLPHKTIISSYKYSLYVDANILIKDTFIYDRIQELVQSETRLSLLQHPFRDCVYQEAYVCIASLKGGWFSILRQILFLKCKGYPKHNGLYEANVIFRMHNAPDVVAMNELWWTTFMKYSKRDQLSLVYALTKHSIPIIYFLPQGKTTRNHYAFEKINHVAKIENRSLKLKKGFIRMITGFAKNLLKEDNE